MDQQRSGGGGGNGKNSNVHPSLSMQQQMQFQGNIPLAQMGNNGGAYYKTSATMMPPPPGFGMQNLNMGTHPAYQQQMGMCNDHLQQNYYPAGGFQQMPMFNNNYGSESMMHPTLPTLGSQNYFSAANENYFNNNGTFDQEIDSRKGTRSPMMMTNGGKTEISNSGGITPMIDNIVGSMMGNGTYTHFGPSGGITAIPSSFATKMEPTISMTQPTGNLSRHESMTERRKESPVLGNSGQSHNNVRASTPNDLVDNVSRPQTPNRPSYSEILAKSSASQNGSVPVASVAAVVTPTSSSTSRKGGPATTNNSNSSSKSASKKDNAHSTRNHRKSENSSSGSGSSANSSSCASLTSSPVAKPKTLSQTIMSRLFTTASMMGKENSSTATTSKTYFRTPSTTPTHQKKNVAGIKSDDRKVLSSQNSENLKQKAKPKLTKPSSAAAAVSNFVDLNADEAVDSQAGNGDPDGWKTCSRNKHSNRTNFNKSFSNEVLEMQDSTFVPPTTSNDNEEDEKSSTGGDSVNDSLSTGESRRESLTEKRSVTSTSTYQAGSSGSAATGTHRKLKEKDRSKNKKDARNTTVQRIERIVYLWAATLISAAAWLLKLVTDVFTLSISVGSTLMQDLYSWWVNKAVPVFIQKFHIIEETIRKNGRKLRESLSWKKWPFRRKGDEENSELKKNSEDLMAALGPDKNIQICNADETLKRLLSCKGQDPYTILGIRSDSSDETIRRYYKKQAVLVHPDKNVVVGAEEAFKILGKAFEMIGESSKRTEYHNKLLEAHAKEQVYGEIGKLLEQLRKKMEIATSSIRCTKCNLRHKKNKTDRPLFAARYCSQCNIHHGAREGELWAETTGWFGLSWNYFTCMDCHIWEINEWAKCQKKNLLHIKADSHCVMYRLVAGGGNGQSGQSSATGQESQFNSNPDDDWDSLINNFCKSGGVPGTKGGDHFYQQGGGATSGNFYTGQGNSPSTSNASAAGRKRKGKRK